MKKVLILSYHFPPENTIGSQRPYRMAKYFEEFGLEPIVFTRKRSDRKKFEFRVVETHFESSPILKMKSKIRKVCSLLQRDKIAQSRVIHQKSNTIKKNRIIRNLYKLILYPGEAKGWRKDTIRNLNEIIEAEGIQVIVSTGPPQVSHMIASEISKKNNITFIMDLRDLWSDNPYNDNPLPLKIMDKYIERKVVSRANVLITVSNHWVNILKEKYTDKPIYCVENGYDSSDYHHLIGNENTSNELVITYAGNLYEGKRDPSALFKAINKMKETNKVSSLNLQVNFYTNENQIIEEMATRYGVEDCVKTYEFKKRAEILRILSKSDILLFLGWDTPSEFGTIPAKLFEYLALKKNILGIGLNEGEARRIVTGSRLGDIYSSKDVEGIQYYLKYMLKRKIQGEIKVSEINDSFIDSFNEKKKMKEMTDIIKKYTQ